MKNIIERGLAMSKKISSKKIAELANVSQSTVSRAFDPKSGVSTETRKKF